jgi:hypothetical protein
MTTAAIDIASTAIETRTSRVPVDGQIEIASAPGPQGPAERLVIKVIGTTETSLFMAAYQMTSKPTVQALCTAAAGGVVVLLVLDDKSNRFSNTRSKRDCLTACGVDVKTDARYAIMYDKFIVLHGKQVESTSFN